MKVRRAPQGGEVHRLGLLCSTPPPPSSSPMAFDEQMCAPGTTYVGLRDGTDSEEWLLPWLCPLSKCEHEFAGRSPFLMSHSTGQFFSVTDQQIIENGLSTSQLFGLWYLLCPQHPAWDLAPSLCLINAEVYPDWLKSWF